VEPAGVEPASRKPFDQSATSVSGLRPATGDRLSTPPRIVFCVGRGSDVVQGRLSAPPPAGFCSQVSRHPESLYAAARSGSANALSFAFLRGRLFTRQATPASTRSLIVAASCRNRIGPETLRPPVGGRRGLPLFLRAPVLEARTLARASLHHAELALAMPFRHRSLLLISPTEVGASFVEVEVSIRGLSPERQEW
jgi:hypothetical protein